MYWCQIYVEAVRQFEHQFFAKERQARAEKAANQVSFHFTSLHVLYSLDFLLLAKSCILAMLVFEEGDYIALMHVISFPRASLSISASPTVPMTA